MADVLDEPRGRRRRSGAGPAPVPATDVRAPGGRRGPDRSSPASRTWGRPATSRCASPTPRRVRPVDDLQPYLGAAGHVVVMRADGSMFAHQHAEVDDDQGRPVFALPGQTFGPDLDLHAGSRRRAPTGSGASSGSATGTWSRRRSPSRRPDPPERRPAHPSRAGIAGPRPLRHHEETRGEERAVDVHFRLLGPMEIVVRGQPMPMPGAAERALLVQLLLSPGRTIPATMLVDRLWSESSLPVDPMNALQIRVSKLRRALKAVGVPDLVSREGMGYRADVEPDAVDAVDFAARIRAARARAAAAGAEPRSPPSSPTTTPWRCGGERRSATSAPSSGRPWRRYDWPS